MNKHRFNPFAIVGAALLLAALLLWTFNTIQAVRAGEKAQEVLGDVKQVMASAPRTTEPSAPQPTEPDASAPPETTAPPGEMPTVTVGYNDYIGYLHIPSQELELPVMSDWSYDKLNVAPCRQFGSYYTDDLVIAAHNFGSHFGKLKNLIPGDTVTFTDVTGADHNYTVASVQTLQPDDVDAVQNSGHALTLYTCTPGGATRVTVFCDRQ